MNCIHEVKFANPIFKVTNNIPVIWGEINGRLGKTKFNSLRILLDYIPYSG